MKNSYVFCKNCILLLALSCLFFLSACGGMSDEDALAALHASDEVWISHGLSAWENGKEAEDLSHIFYDQSCLTYLTLYDHLFSYDPDICIPVAEEFFRFIAEKHGLAAVLDTDKRIAYKTEFLKSMGLDLIYSQQKDAEDFFREIKFHSDSRYSYIFTHENISFCIPSLDLAALSNYHYYIYYTAEFIQEFSDFIRDNGLSEHFDLERRVTFHCENLGTGGRSTSNTSGYVDLHSMADAPHEAFHAFTVYNSDDYNRMLCEGLAEYFASASGLNILSTNTYATTCMNAEGGYYSSYAAAGNTTAQRLTAAWETYSAAGGKYDSLENFDDKLYAHFTALYSRDFGSFSTVHDSAVDVTGILLPPFDGSELTYAESCSFVTWLIDSYDLKTVLDAWQKDDFSGSFGKDYPTLKSEWQTFLSQYK